MKRFTRNVSTPESRAFWESVDRSASLVRAWPSWKRAGINVSITRAYPRHMKLPNEVETILRVFADRYPTVLFGGAVRDLFFANQTPRDLDIVVEGASTGDLLGLVDNPKINGFCGVKGTINGTKVDVWPLSKTKAISEGTFRNEFSSLPKTTFFNIESGIYRVGEARVEDLGIERGLQERTLEINYPNNPFPLLCLIRAAVLSHRYRLKFGPKLIRFGRATPGVSEEQLQRVRKAYYQESWADLNLSQIVFQQCLIESEDPDEIKPSY